MTTMGCPEVYRFKSSARSDAFCPESRGKWGMFVRRGLSSN